MKHEQLQLITPQFETPLPQLQPAVSLWTQHSLSRKQIVTLMDVILSLKVFPPALSELPPPMLDLFDLDETFSSEKVRLAQLTNKCKEIRIPNI